MALISKTPCLLQLLPFPQPAQHRDFKITSHSKHSSAEWKALIEEAPAPKPNSVCQQLKYQLPALQYSKDQKQRARLTSHNNDQPLV
jgi:hypothetical protein